jgi:large subunit ribosomal protein L32
MFPASISAGAQRAAMGRIWPTIKRNGQFAPLKQKVEAMAVQQNKVSKSRRNNRRAHDALKPGNPQECGNCGELKRPHHVCPSCGHYDERQVYTIAEDVDLDEDAA